MVAHHHPLHVLHHLRLALQLSLQLFQEPSMLGQFCLAHFCILFILDGRKTFTS